MIVTIPDERIGGTQLDERDVLVDIAIGLYKREQASLGRARRNREYVIARVPARARTTQNSDQLRNQ